MKLASLRIYPGAIFLIRINNQILIFHVLESWFDGYKVKIIGLELQGTSCHHLEATRIDDIFHQAFMGDSRFDVHSMSALKPISRTVFSGINDSRSGTVGIFDNFEVLGCISGNLLKVLCWFVINDDDLLQILDTCPIDLKIIDKQMKLVPMGWLNYLRDSSPGRDIQQVIKTVVSLYCAIKAIGLFSEVEFTMEKIWPMYQGKFSGTDSRRWIDNSLKLQEVCTSAFRYTIKLTYESAVLEQLFEFEELLVIFINIAKTSVLS